MFSSSSQVLKSWFKHRHNLLPGIVSVLHTSGSDLKYHPHVHMIVTGGGKCLSSNTYEELEGNYLCPQRFLGKQVRACFESSLKDLYKSGKLKVPRGIKTIEDLAIYLSGIGKKHWIVSIQKPLEDLGQIVGYVGRYTKRCCLSEYKIESIDNGRIRFWCNDYKNSPRGGKVKQVLVSLDYVTFLDKLLQHVPTEGYRMVRYMGLYSSYHLRKIPLDLRGDDSVDMSNSDKPGHWGDHSGYRELQIKLGRPDPLYCQNCKVDYDFIAIQYDRKAYKKYYDDS